VDDFQHIGIDSPEYSSDIMASLRARVNSGPPVYWTPTVGANGLLNAAYTASKPELFDDSEAYLGLPRFLAGGFARFHCGSCRFDRLVPFSCKGRAVCSVTATADRARRSEDDDEVAAP
jgi:hypothetical protein